MGTIRTKRLCLRPWRKEDSAPFAEMNSDTRVREFFPSVLSYEESQAAIQAMSLHIQKHGWGFWAVSLLEDDAFIGFIGLMNVDFKASFTPAVEIGWRLAFAHWGKGYATEGAQACLEYGFEKLGLAEIISFTPKQNARSMGVMKKIGMSRNQDDDFDYPCIEKGHYLSKHVLYRISRKEWRNRLNPDQKKSATVSQ